MPYSPILHRLPQTWRILKVKAPLPPLPTHIKPTPRRRKPTKTTRLCKLALRSDPLDERILPLCLPPWKKTIPDFNGRLKVTPATKGTSKDDASLEHILKVGAFTNSPQHLLVYSDGSMLETRGSRRVGAGYVALKQHIPISSRKIGLGKKAEVYDAELAGLSWAARDVATYIRETDPGIKHLHFYADNTSAIKTIFEPKAGPGQGHTRIFREITIAFLEAHPENTVEVEWTPGHKGIRGNELADQLAKKATELDGGPTKATRSHALRRAKERAEEEWVKTWKRTTPSGRYATANHLQPQMHPRKPFTTLPREVYGRLVQCRTGHGFLGEYYDQFVPSETVECPCGAKRQTRQHILQHCPRYKRYRHILRKTSETIELPIILGTQEGIEALGWFIKASGAMTKSGERKGEGEQRHEDEEEGARQSDVEETEGEEEDER
ncbi:hypothetical protein AcV5_010469 [Taiwanofungus camphoratus]|nr:hypothetical protein AcV5_010469 [Antrodia cinnamomea]KAI0934972.1 hypothetical protein AcV7_010382 [Antrodia cinnamomea]